MDKIIASIFKNKVANPAKLTEYGFDANGVYKTGILDGQFELLVQVCGSDIKTQVLEVETDEPYTLFLADGATGSFVGEVRGEYTRVLSDIAEKCFLTSIFKNQQTKQVIDYIRKTYGGELEFLWEKYDDCAIWRRADNRKWYGLLLTVAENKLGLASESVVEAIDLRIDPDDMEKTVDGKTFFHGYHMNKKHWITVILDGSVDIEIIYKMIDRSYSLAKK